ncbi:hypothetical protein EFE41_10015 [Methanohalophilus portucalensis FDF-1]|nr:hypothetical protein BKM01_02270 [Methanohalophilus portucalensis]RNI08826.1 hypothetical protein EFE41_10015 [Methanohalophilus portucalensis FDF-1]
MKNMLKTIGIVALLLLVAIPLISSASAETVNRDLSSQTVAPGDTITVTLDVNDPNDRIIVDDMVPAGWSITDAGTGNTSETDHIKWVEFGTVASTTYTYDVQVPMSATDGTYNFDGTYILSSAAEASILGESEVTVTSDGNGDAMDVNRDLSSQTVAPGDTITVTLDVNDPNDRIIVDDMVPAGWSITDAGTGNTSETDHIKWVEFGTVASTTYTYDVQVPMSATDGTYNFDGTYILSSAAEASILGESEVTVTSDGNGDAMDVSRDLSSQTVAPGDTITVALDVNDPDDRIIVDEMIPAGLTLTDAGTGNTSEVDHIKWVEFGTVASTTYTYDVQVPMSATDGTVYNFDGTYILTSGQTETTITGELQATVEVEDEVSATRDIMPDPAEVGPCDEFNVSITVENDGSNVNVVETIPEGFECVGSTLGVPNPPEGNEVTFILNGETSFEYTVRAANGEGTYTFDGMVVDTEENEYPVGGETTIDVVLPEGIAIQPGWNFMSVPSELNNSSVGYVLADVNYDALVYYNASSGTWDTVTEFEPLKGYWIKSSEECTQVIAEDMLEPEVPSVPATMTVYEGWNAIGYTDSTDTLSAELVLVSIDDSYDTVKGPYNPATMSYEQVGHNGETGVISGIHVGTDVYDMGPYEGHWVYVTEETTLSGF